MGCVGKSFLYDEFGYAMQRQFPGPVFSFLKTMRACLGADPTAFRLSNQFFAWHR